jgi:hypothetical protein
MLKLKASSAHVWAVIDGCPGSIKISEKIPYVPSPYADEGTTAHNIAAQMVKEHLGGQTILRTADTYKSIPDEMFYGARIYATDIIPVARMVGPTGEIGIEKKLPCPDIHPDMKCIPDAFILNKNAGHLYLWEFKYGFTPVNAFQNPQLICNTSAIGSFFNLDDQKITVHARVIQPRGYKGEAIDEWVFPLSDIRGPINIYRENARIALGEDSYTRSGPHCKNCNARTICKAAMDCGMSIFEEIGKPIPDNMTDEALGFFYALILRAKEQIKCLESGIEMEVKNRLNRGIFVPGASYKPMVGRLEWVRPAAQVVAMGDLMGVNLRKEMEVITPTQAKNILDEKIIEKFTKRESKGFNLITDSEALLKINQRRLLS